MRNWNRIAEKTIGYFLLIPGIYSVLIFSQIFIPKIGVVYPHRFFYFIEEYHYNNEGSREYAFMGIMFYAAIMTFAGIYLIKDKR